MEKPVFLYLKIFREGVLVPAEENAGGDGFDIHGRGFQYTAVSRSVLDDFLVEHLVLPPAGDGAEVLEMIRERGDVEVAPDEIGGVAILFSRLKIPADHELEKAYRVVFHAVNINE